MAALGLVIAAEDLSLAGITGDLSAALVGLTWTEAHAKLHAVLGLAAGNAALRNGGRASYAINGRSTTFDLEQLRTALAVISQGLRAASTPGGMTTGLFEFARA
jgi:hypothetical protein